MNLVPDTAIPPFINNKGKDVNSDWLADQWDERSVLGHAQFHKGRMKGDDPWIDTAQTPKRFDWRLALLGKILKTFTDSIPNKIVETLWQPFPRFTSAVCHNKPLSPVSLLVFKVSANFVGETRYMLCPKRLVCPPVQWVKARAQ